MIGRLSAHINYRAVRNLAKRRQALHLERPVVSITFDDFPKSAWTKGGDVLRRFDVKASYYLSAGHCGDVVGGIRQYDREDLVAIAAEGHELGCHTAHHRRLPDLTDAAINADLKENAAFLADILPHQAMTTFAYPYGAVSLRTKRLASSRFDACRGVWAGINTGYADLALLSCVCLEAHILRERSLAEWIAETVRQRGWLVFLTHDVSVTPSPFGVTPALLEEVVERAFSAGCDVLPLKTVVDAVADSAK